MKSNAVEWKKGTRTICYMPLDGGYFRALERVSQLGESERDLFMLNANHTSTSRQVAKVGGRLFNLTTLSLGCVLTQNATFLMAFLSHILMHVKSV